MKKILLYLLLVLSLFFLPSNSYAAEVTWDGGGDGGSWGSAENWSTDAVPGPEDDVIIDDDVTVEFGDIYSVDVANGGIASGDFDGDESQLFDNVTNVRVASGTSGTHTISYDFGEGNEKTITRYAVRNGDTTDYFPKGWTFQGSSNDVDWVTLDVVADQTGWKDWEMRKYNSFSNPENISSYRYYRWTQMYSKYSSYQTYLAELDMMETLPAYEYTVNTLTLGNVGETTSPTLNFSADTIGQDKPLVTVGDLTVYPNAVITHSAATSQIEGSIYIEVGGNALIEGSVNANFKGFPAGYGDGKGSGGSILGSGGAGHGGSGGYGYATNAGGIYGSLKQPIDLGSAGGGYDTTSNRGGAGGGVIKMVITGSLEVNRDISANGENGPTRYGAGGSGGSIYITTGTLQGTGSISAIGGNARDTTLGNGGGGGGRIAIYYSSYGENVPALNVYGGAGGGDPYPNFGGSGTIYMKNTSTDEDELIIDNNNHNLTDDRRKGKTILDDSNYDFDVVTLKNYGNLVVNPETSITYTTLNWSEKGVVTDNGGTFTLVSNGGDLDIPETAILFANTPRSFENISISGILTHSDNRGLPIKKIDLEVSGNLTINDTGSIDVTGRGEESNYGEGEGGNTSSSTGGSGGGGYGGTGGSGSNASGIGGITYGSVYQPVDIGSGGGGYFSASIAPGGDGGGSIDLSIDGTLTISTLGKIIAGGKNTPTSYGGGGSGGGIYIFAGSINGSGQISANGGNGDVGKSGGGGGGRIAIYYGGGDYSGSVTANGGTGYNAGQNGTTVIKGTGGEIISTPFDTGDPGTVLSDITWTESLDEGTDVKFQLQTAPDSDGSPGEWSGWLGPNGINSYYTDPTGITEEINSAHNDTLNDQWFQYKIILSANEGDGNIPTVTDVNIEYVVNTAPTVSVTNNPSQSSLGVINVNYDCSDPEEAVLDAYLLADIGITLNEELTSIDDSAITLSSTANLPQSGTILVDNEMISYTSISGNDLVGVITRGINNTRAADHSSTTAVWFKAASVTGDTGESISTGSGKSIAWTARNDIVDLETDSAVLKVFVNDGNSANQVASDTTTSLILDTKAPVDNDIIIDSRLDQLTLSSTDANSILMKISNESDLSSDGVNNDSANWIDYALTKNWTMPSTEPETVYVKYKDEYGNETSSTYSTTGPEKVSSVLIQDASNPETEEWRLFVSWAVSEEPVEGFAYYQLYRSTDNITYNELVQIETISQNFYLNSDLSSSATYYYKVTVVDDHGNESNYNLTNQVSGAASKSGIGLVPDGSGGGDFTAPVISDLTVSDITATTAKFTWTTDELADSKIGYSTDTEYENEVGTVTVTQSHEVILTGLTANTKYYYRAISYDGVSNKGIEEDSSIYYFATTGDESGPLITDIKTVVGETTAGITWATNEAADSLVEYGLDTSYGNSSSSASLVLGHSMSLTGLDSGTEYHYRVKSADSSGNLSTSPDYTFTTLEKADELDTTAPTISNISVSDVTPTSAKISWETDEDADGKVEYGETSDYERGIAEGNHDYIKSKSVTIIGLSPEVEYHYRIIAVDEAGNVNTSSDATFSTSEQSILGSLSEIGSSSGSNAPSISSQGPSISNITGTSVTISWSTTKRSTSEVYYRIKNSEGSVNIGGNATAFVSDHEIVLTGLNPATTYEYQVKSTDVNGNYVVSSKYEFTTSLPDVASVRVIDTTENSATISWTTMIPTASIVEYINSQTGDITTYNDPSLVLNHIVKLSDLYSSTLYAFSVLIKDEGGNLARSAQYSFQTSEDGIGPAINAVNTKSTIVSGQNKVQTVVTWSTNEPTTSRVQYSMGNSAGDEYEFETRENTDFVLNHIVVLPDLKPATVYRYRVISKDRSGNRSESEPYVLLTPQREVSALDLIMRNLESIFGWTKKIGG